MNNNKVEDYILQAQVFPFILRNWERRRVLRYLPEIYHDGETIFVNEDGSVETEIGYSLYTKPPMPRWFRAWLWLRTIVSKRRK